MICLTNIFEPFILVITLKTLKITCSVLFGKHIIPDGSSRVLQLQLHLSKLTINSGTIFDCIHQGYNQ